MSVLTWSDLTAYDTSTVRQRAPEFAGVYRLCRRATDGKYYLFYVGQAASIRDRLLDHLQDSEPNQCIKRTVRASQCAYQYLIVQSAVERDRLEREQIREFNPDCNKQ